MINNPILTIDLDWADDCAINYVNEILTKYNVRSTFFITHDSLAVSKLLKNNLFDFGLHPNFQEDSTQGKSVEEVMRYLKDITASKIVRMHRLYQHTSLFENLVKDHNMEVDLSLFLPDMDHICPFEFVFNNTHILRIPYYWEDDIEIRHLKRFKLDCYNLQGAGLKIFNFHPVHIYNNDEVKHFFLELVHYLSDKNSCTISDIATSWRKK